MAKKYLALALQGGGAHGALTWGVLDRLLEEKDLQLEGFSGTSAGAMNAAVLAYGLHRGGKEDARELLHKFWELISVYGNYSLFQPGVYDKVYGKGNMDYSWGFLSSEIASIFFSPYQFNPLDINPLRDIIEKVVDFDSLTKCSVTKLFVCATNVRKGRLKVFSLKDISADAVLASACLPYLYKAVTIDGEDYWDGGFMGNPPIFPLIDAGCRDIMVVQINPINIDKTPRTSSEIRDRINELSFNSSLMLEMRRIAFVDRLLDLEINPNDQFRRIFLHHINPEEDVQHLNLSSKLNTRWDFIQGLFETGRKCADRWLDENFDQIGQNSTVNVRETFL